MTRSDASHLKVFREPAAPSSPPQIDALRSLSQVLQSFRLATGWTLRYKPVEEADLPIDDGAVGHLVLEPGPDEAAAPNRIEQAKAQRLAQSLTLLLGEAMSLQHALWHREAELAAGVPIALGGDAEPHLALRLQSVLKAGADAVGCQAAALYLLDEATTELKLRACWGLPLARLTEPARPLRGAMADLEAMLGHAVVLEDELLADAWCVPEKFPAAVCVPISSSAAILGTMWVFAKEARNFNDSQTNMLEVTAGRIAAELEREMLREEGASGVRLKRQTAEAGQLQRDQLPSTPPQVEGWDMAGWGLTGEGLTGELFDWFALGDRRVATAVVQASGTAVQAALVAATAKSAIRSHAQHLPDPEKVVAAANRTLWTASAGDQYASVYYGTLETSGKVLFSTAGALELFRVDAEGWCRLSVETPRAGQDPELVFAARTIELPHSGLLLVCTPGLLVSASDDRPFDLDELLPKAHAAEGRPVWELTARQIASHIQRKAADRLGASRRHDATLLVIKRTAAPR